MEGYNNKFWTESLTEDDLTAYKERLFSYKNYLDAQGAIVNPNVRKGDSSTSKNGYLDFLKGRKLVADKLKTKKAITDSMYKKFSDGIYSSEVLENSEQYKEIVNSVSNYTKLKSLKLYFDSYMSESGSDSQWRLGNVIASINNPDEDSEDLSSEVQFCDLVSGEAYTRSNFGIKYDWEYYNGAGGIGTTAKYYSSLQFPPYKIGAKNDILKKTSLMGSVYADNPDATFDQDNFLIDRDEYTFRDVGMKSLSDYINYLQWLTEGLTGIVFTYLTEWDLSVYIQEGLMTPKVNGGAMKIYLNHRIHDDNPLAGKNKDYVGDKALCFNVCGSAVSKLESDNKKMWRPSDFPMSSFWMPYLKGKDWTLNKFNLSSGDSIPYMSFYDDLTASFDYENSDMMDVIKHQDLLGIVSGSKNRMDLCYYDAIYYSPDEGMTDFEITMNNLIKNVAGADYGTSTSDGKDIDYMIKSSRLDMIENGGYYGGPQTTGSDGGYINRLYIGSEASGDSSKMTLSKMLRNSKTSANKYYDSNKITQAESGTTAATIINSSSVSKDSSSLSKMTGINRLSPALFGGPHGSDCSPMNLRSYLDLNSVIMRNIPRLNPSFISDFSESNLYSGLDAFYTRKTCKEDAVFDSLLENAGLVKQNSGITDDSYGQSPSFNIYHLKNGFLFPSYKSKTVNETVSEMIEQSLAIENSKLEVKKVDSIGGNSISYENWKNPNYSKKIMTYTEFVNKYYNGIDDGRVLKYFKSKLGSGASNNTIANSSLIIDIPYCKGTYLKSITKLAKTYTISDMPDIDWYIVQHSFESYTASPDIDDKFWQGIYNDNYISSTKFHEDAASFIKSSSPGFILRFPSDITGKINKKILSEMILHNKGKNWDSPTYLVFFEGNNGENNTFEKDGADSIIVAPCYVRFYRGYSDGTYSYIPYVEVDLLNTKYFYDNLRQKPDTNYDVSSIEVPLHLNSEFHANTVSVNSNPIQKMRYITYDTMSSYSSASGEISWTSTSRMALSGKGILTQIPGIDPDYDDFTGNQKDFITADLSKDAKDKQLCSLDFNLYEIVKSGSTLSIDSSGKLYSEYGDSSLTYVDSDGNYIYNGDTLKKISTPVGIRKSIVNALTRIKFYTSEKREQIILDSSVPFRNFYSQCLTERNYFNSAKGLFETLDLSYIRKLLLTNVDKCTLKASGLSTASDGTTTLVTPDTKHVLYNYWIDQAIKMLYDSNKLESKRVEILSSFNERIFYLDSCIDKMSSIICKTTDKWTYNEFILIYNLINAETKRGTTIVDKFMMSYLSIMYYYRLFFIGKRFNKEDGTMWIMRALESTIDFTASESATGVESPGSWSDVKSYAVPFYELQNSIDEKKNAILTGIALEKDKVNKIYVKVVYGTEADWKKWIAYKNGESSEKVQEMIRFYVDNDYRYAYKPDDGLYMFRSKEYDENIKNEIWNSKNTDETQKVVESYKECVFNIKWRNDSTNTPIKWDVFGTVNANNLLEYASGGITGQELLCLSKESSDFWTISIPEGLWPNKSLYMNGLYIMQVKESEVDDPYVSVIGPFANSVSPILANQEDATTDLMSEIKNIVENS